MAKQRQSAIAPPENRQEKIPGDRWQHRRWTVGTPPAFLLSGLISLSVPLFIRSISVIAGFCVGHGRSSLFFHPPCGSCRLLLMAGEAPAQYDKSLWCHCCVTNSLPGDKEGASSGRFFCASGKPTGGVWLCLTHVSHVMKCTSL